MGNHFQWLVCDEDQGERQCLESAQARERQVLKLVAEGHTSKEVARIVGVKLSSVYTYRSRIMSKLESRNDAELVRFAIRHRLIKP